MSVDISQFHQIFFEESFEGLDVMEDSLMALTPDNIDSETINAIFRAAHSIKGGSATFGFMVVADFTHVLETLLDETRDGKRGMSTDDVELYLQSVDCMRALLTALQAKEEPDTDSSDALKAQFQAILDGKSEPAAETAEPAPAEPAPVAVAEAPAAPVSQGWSVDFVPNTDMLRTGNEPYRMFRELAELGELEVEVSSESLPELEAMEPEVCYLSWTLRVRGEGIEESQVKEVFDWVEDEAKISIEALSADAGSTDNSSDAWHISFLPELDVLRTGNEPYRMIRELSELGSLKVGLQTDRLPELNAMDPESCYLGWNFELLGDVSEAQIKEVFEWVEDEAEIVISRGSSAPAAAAASPDAPVAAAPAVAAKVESAAVEASPQAVTAVTPAPDAAKAAAPAKAAPAKAAAPAESSSIRVAIDKIDSLINMVGELVITQSMLGQIGDHFTPEKLPQMLEGLGQLEQNTRELQESVMRIRMLPISFSFNRFPRLVRDIGRQIGKDIQLVMQGEQTELDKTVLEKIGDPMVHLVRNSADHGLETPDEREAAGKNRTGTVTLNAYHKGGNIIIEVIDDGRGLNKDRIIEKAIENGLYSEDDIALMNDQQIYDMIFQPGFSTADAVSDLSGRGVGMDVVRRNIQELNGSVEINSTPGKGSVTRIRLPLTLAILDGQLVRLGDQTFICPLVSIIESLQMTSDRINYIAGGSQVYRLRNEYIPIIHLSKAFNVQADTQVLEDALLVVVEADGEKVGILVDELLAQQQVVIKSLEDNYHRTEGVSGATILGDGRISLIIDITGIVQMAGVKMHDVQRLNEQAGAESVA